MPIYEADHVACAFAVVDEAARRAGVLLPARWSRTSTGKCSLHRQVAEEKLDLYARAVALLMPIRWAKPFGLVMTEAMACGTPVIAFREGSAPELVVERRDRASSSVTRARWPPPSNDLVISIPSVPGS